MRIILALEVDTTAVGQSHVLEDLQSSGLHELRITTDANVYVGTVIAAHERKPY